MFLIRKENKDYKKPYYSNIKYGELKDIMKTLKLTSQGKKERQIIFHGGDPKEFDKAVKEHAKNWLKNNNE